MPNFPLLSSNLPRITAKENIRFIFAIPVTDAGVFYWDSLIKQVIKSNLFWFADIAVVDTAERYSLPATIPAGTLVYDAATSTIFIRTTEATPDVYNGWTPVCGVCADRTARLDIATSLGTVPSLGAVFCQQDTGVFYKVVGDPTSLSGWEVTELFFAPYIDKVVRSLKGQKFNLRIIGADGATVKIGTTVSSAKDLSTLGNFDRYGVMFDASFTSRIAVYEFDNLDHNSVYIAMPDSAILNFDVEYKGANIYR